MRKDSFISNMIGIFLFASVAFNFRILKEPSVFLSNVLILSLCLLMFFIFSIYSTRTDVSFNSKHLLISIFILMLSLVGFDNGRFYISYFKWAYLIVSYYFFSIAFINKNIDINRIFKLFALGMLISTLTTTDLKSLSEISTASRLNVDDLGNFNSYSLLISITIIICLYLIKVESSKIKKFILSMGVFYLLIIMLTTFSRGGFYGLLIGCVFYIKYFFKRKLLVGIVFGSIVLAFLALVLLFSNADYRVFLDRYLFEGDSTGSGRLLIYAFLFEKITESATSIIFGKGLGSISYYTGLGFQIQAGHSTYVDMFFQFGLIGLILFIYFIWGAYKSIKKMPETNESKILLIIFMQLCLTAIIDSYYDTTQMGWLFSFFFAIFYGKSIFIQKGAMKRDAIS